MQISDQIIQVLNYLCQKFGIVVDWTSANVMPYLQELCGKFINYKIGISIVWMVLGILIIISTSIPLYIMKKIDKNDPYDKKPWCVMIAICIGAAGIGVIICQAINIVTCYTLPEKVIFDFISTQLNK